jgi:peptide chain release factor 1
MKKSLLEKLETISDRKVEVEEMLATPHIIKDQAQFKALSKEHAEIVPLAMCFERYRDMQDQLASVLELTKEDDVEMREMANDELLKGKIALSAIEQEVLSLLIPKDPNDAASVYLEIRAGTGGNEAGIFVGNLLRMYLRYAEKQQWQTEIISSSGSEAGGYKEVIALIDGKNVFSKLKFESGAHRVQRVPETESQGRVHTSACTVAIMPQVDEAEIEINPNDLRIDTFRASGAGGQHINKTDSAIRITHLPTNVVVECQDERSQHKNRARALSLLQSRLLQAERDRIDSEQASTRKKLVGSGDRSERIRTYNYPQGRVTDHRINLTIYKLDEVLIGDLDLIINPLVSEHQAELIAGIQAD